MPEKKKKKKGRKTENALWALFTLGQIFSAGNMNYQQEEGYNEINPLYGENPSKGRVYSTKIGELGALYALTKVFPKYEKELLTLANSVCFGFIASDKKKGVKMKVRW